jgi:predicted CopG family antitoxin
MSGDVKRLKTLRISEEVYSRLKNIKLLTSYVKGKNITYDELLTVFMNVYEALIEEAKKRKVIENSP